MMRVLDQERVRKIRKGFCWIDRRFLQDKFIYDLNTNEILYYLFLILASDRYGISFYSKEKTVAILKISIEEIEEARLGLEEKGFVIAEKDVIQILDLPDVLGCERFSFAQERSIKGIQNNIIGEGGVLSKNVVKNRDDCQNQARPELAKKYIKDILDKLSTS